MPLPRSRAARPRARAPASTRRSTPPSFSMRSTRSRAMAELRRARRARRAPRRRASTARSAVHRRFDAVRVPLADVKLIKNRLGGTVNDVVLAAATAGCASCCRRGEEPPREPASERWSRSTCERGRRHTLGNRISSLFVHLPVAEADPLRALRPQVERGRGAESPATRRAAARRSSSSPPSRRPSSTPSWPARCSRRGSSTSRSRTSPARRAALRVRLAAGRGPGHSCRSRPSHSVGIAVVSYDGDLYFGLIGDRDSTQDLGVLSYGIAQAIAACRCHCRVFARVGHPLTRVIGVRCVRRGDRDRRADEVLRRTPAGSRISTCASSGARCSASSARTAPARPRRSGCCST